MTTFAEKVISFCKEVEFKGTLPNGISIMNPFRENPEIISVVSDFYISSICPLGFTAPGKNGKEINYNYYDSKKLTETVLDFIISSIKRQFEFGIERNICFCLGTGKNYKFFLQLNNNLRLFDKIVPLEHPRYVMQYKLQQKHIYIERYINEFQKV